MYKSISKACGLDRLFVWKRAFQAFLLIFFRISFFFLLPVALLYGLVCAFMLASGYIYPDLQTSYTQSHTHTSYTLYRTSVCYTCYYPRFSSGAYYTDFDSNSPPKQKCIEENDNNYTHQRAISLLLFSL